MNLKRYQNIGGMISRGCAKSEVENAHGRGWSVDFRAGARGA